jgi:hypothetical protein
MAGFLSPFHLKERGKRPVKNGDRAMEVLPKPSDQLLPDGQSDLPVRLRRPNFPRSG